MKKNILFLILLFNQEVSFAQNAQWANFLNYEILYNPLNIEHINCVDKTGNVYFTGFKDNYFNSGNIYGNMFYRKYNTNGTLIFEKTIVGNVRVFNIISDYSNNIYLSVSFKNSLTIDNSSISGNTTEQPLLLKFDSLGNLLWYKSINFANSSKNFTALTVDDSNMVYIGYDDFFNSSIKKFDSLGNELLTINQANVKIISSLSVDSLGNIYAAGSCVTPNSVFAGVSSGTSFLYSNYAVKYSSSGTYQWVKFVEETSCLDPQISAKTPNNIYFSSVLTGSFNFDALPTVGPTNASFDFFITKLNANGSFQWVKEVPNSANVTPGKRNFLDSDLNGNVYFAGYTSGIINWTPTITSSSMANNSDVLVLKINPAGDYIFAKTLGGPSYERANSISVDSNENVFVSGHASHNTIFDTFSFSGSNAYPFLTKLGSTLGINDFEVQVPIIYPNPVSKELFVSNNLKNSSGVIVNLLGQKMIDFELKYKSSVDVSRLETGFYFLKLQDSKPVKFFKN